MATYADPDDLVALSIISDALTDIAEETQEQALEAASMTADSYFRLRYKLPLSNVGLDVKQAVCNIAAYNLLAARGYNPETGDNESVRTRYEDAIKWLRDVSNTVAIPSFTDSSTVQANAGAVPQFAYQPDTSADDDMPVVSRPKLRGW